MKNDNTNNKPNANHADQAPNQEKEVDVLYQKMGDRWFAFSMIDDEVFFGSISPDELENVPPTEIPGSQSARDRKTFKISGNS